MEDQSSSTLNVSTRLAFDRTRLAYDRTMLAWIRTATSLITFGFSVYKFFSIELKNVEPGTLIGTREFAVIMISIGLLFPLEYWLGLKVLELSPMLGIINGMAFLIKAGMLTGAFYVQAFALFATAAAMG